MVLCLDQDQDARPTAQELLNHPFITENVAESSIDNESAIDIAIDLTTFYKQSVFQSGVYSCINEVTEFRKMLESVWETQNEINSKEELQ